MTDERRASARRTAHLPGELESAQGKSAIAITRDVSAGGLLVLTRLKLEVGAAVKLLVLWNDEQVIVQGTVVREQTVEPDESTLWRTKVAIAVDANDAGLAKIYSALEQQ